MDDIVRRRQRNLVTPAQVVSAVIQLSSSCERDGAAERARLLDLAEAFHWASFPHSELGRLRAYAESLVAAESPDGGK